jgi:hypothetical protein
MDPTPTAMQMITRRHFFSRSATGIGGVALASLLNPALLGARQQSLPARGSSTRGPYHTPRAKRVIYLFQAGAPSQMELFDFKPRLDELQGIELPDSVRNGQRITGMSSGQNSLPVTRPMVRFARHGRCGAWVSNLLPYTAGIVDNITIVKTLHTEAINHDPAMTFIVTGHEQPGRPSLGAWASYGLGSDNQNLPTFVVLHSKGSAKVDAIPLASRMWGTAFLPSMHQGVRFRSSGDPILYLNNPPGIAEPTRRRMLDRIGRLNQLQHEEVGDPEILTRIAQYELAYRMQSGVPELMDLSDESEMTLRMYGPDASKPGTYGANCLLARRLIERGVRFVQLFHRGWDHHEDLPVNLSRQCRDTDQPSAALVQDLKQRGLLDDTLVVWAGEFGRTVYCQGELTANNYGRDHHPRCFSIWMAGGGTKPGITYGETDDFSYNIVDRPVHLHDLNATILHCLGLDHEQLTYRFQGRDYRLTDVHGDVAYDLLA